MTRKIIGNCLNRTQRRKRTTSKRSRRAASSTLNFPEIKWSHKIILQALEIANLALKRVVTVEEIIKALTLKELEQLRENYAKDINELVGTILGLLIKRGSVFSPGKIGKKRFYGSANVLDPSTSSLPDVKSRRQRVLGLVRATVMKKKRAVLVGDVLNFATDKPECGDIVTEQITRDILGLVSTRDILIVDTVRGDNRGTNLYLPSDLDPVLYMPKEPLTWLELVAKIFGDVWEEHKKQAGAMNQRPRPVTTNEVRAHLSALPAPHPNLDNPKLVVNALLQLAGTDRPLIRNIDREGEKSARWIPLNILDDEIDLDNTYASDYERVSEAVGRAVKRLGRPVTVIDVRDEIDRDSYLRPAGKSSIASILSEAAKETPGVGGLPRRSRAKCWVFRAGKLNDKVYYYNDAQRLPIAKSYIRLRHIEAVWEASRIVENLQGIKVCSLVTAAAGRAMMAVADTERFLDEIGELLKDGALEESTREEISALRLKIRGVANAAKEGLALYSANNSPLPSEVALEVPGWTANELLKVISPLYPAARNLSRPSQIIPLLESDIRRVPNPNYENRFATDPHAAAESIFDRTDALIYMAITFGGRESRLQARLARHELGLLRDPRFIFPALHSNDFHQRLIGVSCLAFLWSEEGNEYLKGLATGDLDPGVRQSALWAYCNANASDGLELLKSNAQSDPDEGVRSFARNIIHELSHGGNLWEV